MTDDATRPAHAAGHESAKDGASRAATRAQARQHGRRVPSPHAAPRARVADTAGGGARGLGDGRGACSAGTEVRTGARRKVRTRGR